MINCSLNHEMQTYHVLPDVRRKFVEMRRNRPGFDSGARTPGPEPDVVLSGRADKPRHGSAASSRWLGSRAAARRDSADLNRVHLVPGSVPEGLAKVDHALLARRHLPGDVPVRKVQRA